MLGAGTAALRGEVGGLVLMLRGPSTAGGSELATKVHQCKVNMSSSPACIMLGAVHVRTGSGHFGWTRRTTLLMSNYSMYCKFVNVSNNSNCVQRCKWVLVLCTSWPWQAALAPAAALTLVRSGFG